MKFQPVLLSSLLTRWPKEGNYRLMVLFDRMVERYGNTGQREDMAAAWYWYNRISQAMDSPYMVGGIPVNPGKLCWLALMSIAKG